MSGQRCADAVGFETLVAYWQGELGEAAQASFEEHLFGCAACTVRLERLAALASGIRAVVRRGAVRAMITPSLLARMKHDGLRLREYRVAPGGFVACTIGPDDDAVVGRLQAELAGVERIDALESLDLGDGRVQRWRLDDVPFDRASGEVINLPSATMLRRMPAHTFRIRLVAVDASGERTLGDYAFVHTPS